MSSDSFVVLLVNPEDRQPFKSFTSWAKAQSFAAQSVDSGKADATEIWLVAGVTDARRAIAAAQMGEAKFLVRRSHKPTDEEMRRAEDMAWKRAQEKGTEAVLEYLGL